VGSQLFATLSHILYYAYWPIIMQYKEGHNIKEIIVIIIVIISSVIINRIQAIRFLDPAHLFFN
jgi:hypothetical protein